MVGILRVRQLKLISICKDVKTGKVFNSNIKGTFEWYTELLENKDDYIGKMVTHGLC